VGAKSFRDGLRMGVEVFHALKKVLKAKATTPPSGMRALRTQPQEQRRGPELSAEPSSRRLQAGKDIWIALARRQRAGQRAKEKGKQGYCFFKSDPDRVATSDEMIDIWPPGWPSTHRSIEDGLAEGDWAAGPSSPRSSAARYSSSATTCSSPTSSSSIAAWPKAPPTVSHQGQPIGR